MITLTNDPLLGLVGMAEYKKATNIEVSERPLTHHNLTSPKNNMSKEKTIKMIDSL